MDLRIALACWGFPRGDSIAERMEARARRGGEEGASMLVFPECLMHTAPPSPRSAAACAEPLTGPFVTQARKLARTFHVALVVPMYETAPEGGLPYNTCVVIDEAGEIVCSYRKCHLYDAHGVSETDITRSGDELAPVFDIAGARVSLGICYDLRFAEVARSAALDGADLMLFPAAWHEGPGKRLHWETLLRARAIENEFFCCGVCHMGARYVGASLVAGPTGEDVGLRECASSTGEHLLWLADLDLTRVAAARQSMDILSHRRPELYGVLTQGR